MAPSSDEELQHVLERQQQYARQVDRILWVVLPILAFVLTMIIANWNIASTLGTFIMLMVTFVAVGIKRKPLAWVVIAAVVYCLIDNYLSYGQQLNLVGLRRQLLCSILFIMVIGLFRPLAERSWILQAQQKPKK